MTNIYHVTRCKSVADFRSLMTKFFAFAVIALLTGIVSFAARAQNPNLVPNSSFRNYYTLPKPTQLSITPHTPNNKLGLHWIVRRNEDRFKPYFEDSLDPEHVHDWFRANQATPDYYHIFPPGSYVPYNAVSPNAGVGIPHNWGQDSLHPLYPVSGGDDSAYAGFFTERWPASDSVHGTGYYDWHEYLALKLNNHLETGTYLVKFHYAIAQYETTEEKKDDGKKVEYYLKNLGVAFAPTTLFLDYYLPPSPLLSRSTWYEEGSGPTFNNLPMALYSTNYVETHNLPYVNPGTWGTFESYFACSDTTLQYIIIGNFQQRIALEDIGLTPLDLPSDEKTIDDSNHYRFYFFIDSVEVRKVESGACQCKSIFTCPHTRNEPLQDSSAHPNTCCFTTPIIPAQTSCPFWSVRIKIGDTVISDPPTKDFGKYIKFGDTVSASFCIPKTSSEDSNVLIQYQFLDSTGAVVCVKNEYAQCICNCFLADENIAEGVPVKIIEHTLTKIANDSSKCCWEYALKNNYSCSYLNDYKLEIEISGGGTTIVALPGWTDSLVGSTHIFSSTNGLKYNTTSKVFKICTEAQSSPYPPKVYSTFRKNASGTQCRSFRDSLVCRESENCCDKLSIELRRGTATSSSECKFDLVIRHLNSLSKCKVYGIRVKTLGGTTLHTMTGSPLNLDSPKIIWSDNLGGCGIDMETGKMAVKSATYIIEVLDSAQAVKCSVQKTFECCFTTANASKRGALEEEQPQQLANNGIITETKIDGTVLRYTIVNNGEAAIPATIRLSGLTGDAILQRTVKLAKANNAGEFDVSKLASGTYFLTVQTNNWQTTRQISIIR
ncbi:MAG: T9SS type A sorting domain-containing protein [Candidatus Kapaibacterium sp.]